MEANGIQWNPKIINSKVNSPWPRVGAPVVNVFAKDLGPQRHCSRDNLYQTWVLDHDDTLEDPE
jgi:hypothetical protein